MSSNEKSLELSSRPAAEAYTAKVCFKQGPPALIGAELEWLTAFGDGSRPTLSALAAALGDHSPRSISPDSPALSLPGGSIVTVEPGGQIELSSSPYPSVVELAPRLDSDARILAELLRAAGIDTDARAADPDRSPQRLLMLPRYCEMETRFSSIGPFGALMMCNTAAAQVSVDAGRDHADITARWQMLHAIGPAFVAAFACSPRLAGAPQGSWASQRMRTWLELDSSRTAVVTEGDPIADYARWALGVPLLCVLGTEQDRVAPVHASFAQWIDDPSLVGRPATIGDLDYHLTTLFPRVRACGHLEIRYIDAQPAGEWVVPAAAFEALLSTPEVTREATALAESTAGRWVDAARHGLADPRLRSTAADLLDLAAIHAGEFGVRLLDAAQRCRDGRAPTATSYADDRKESA